MPPQIVCVKEFEGYARKILEKDAFDYYHSGAQDMLTTRENEMAFDRIYILPRILRDMTEVDTSITFLGKKLSSPIFFAPTAMQKMAHPDGECATVKAACKTNTCMVLSSWSTTSLEDVVEAETNVRLTNNEFSALRLFQLYIFKDREMTERLVKRAQSAGYLGLVITVDAPYLGHRYADIRNKFQLPKKFTLANFSSEHACNQKLADSENRCGLEVNVANQIDPSVTWKDVEWVKGIADMPIFIKGVLTVEDAELAVNAGVAGIIVSNHGGRQLDSVPPTIEALPRITSVVSGRIEILVDGGIRRGTDVLKALAMGATAVLVGRPVLYALACKGEAGVIEMYDILHKELTLAMALAGCAEIVDIDKSCVIRKYDYQKSNLF